MHEAAHAVTYSILCGVASRVYVLARGGGVCIHGRVGAVRADAVATAAGEAGESWAFASAVPAIRPRPRRRRRIPDAATAKPDRVLLSELRRMSELEMRLGESAAAPLDVAAVQREAAAFVGEHVGEILALARVLYRRGAVFVPARRS